MEKKIERILIVVAMEGEGVPMAEYLGLSRDKTSRIPAPSPAITFSGITSDISVMLVINGLDPKYNVDCVGTVPAAITTFLAIKELNPDLIISTGTAGGFEKRGAKVANVYVSSYTMNHDRRISLLNFDQYGLDKRRSLPVPKLQKTLNIDNGVVSTGNSFDFTKSDIDFFIQHSVLLKEMEASAVAWVSGLFCIPMFCLKAVSDIVDSSQSTSAEQFEENFDKAICELKLKLKATVGFCLNKSPSEL